MYGHGILGAGCHIRPNQSGKPDGAYALLLGFKAAAMFGITYSISHSTKTDQLPSL
jgi:hypothetical protein